jgi:Peptidase M10 serralysin C terminal/RTX calcium-binding nonapeptide repeat (4 copies)
LPKQSQPTADIVPTPRARITTPALPPRSKAERHAPLQHREVCLADFAHPRRPSHVSFGCLIDESRRGQEFFELGRRNPCRLHETSTAIKWGSPTPGTTGGTVTYWFDTASAWNPTEQAAFTSGLDLWSAEVDITFSLAASAASANVIFYREPNQPDPPADPDEPEPDDPDPKTGSAYEWDVYASDFRPTVGTGMLASHASTGTYIAIDTTVPGFGPLNGSFDTAGGYPYSTVVHEQGHLLGLGHAGPYNGNVDPETQQFSAYDTLLWSLMSYIYPWDESAQWFSSYPVTGTDWGTSPDGWYYVPTTPMIADILAAQQLYGAATSGPLASGGQVFGFNTTITGSLGLFFDFTQNTHPVITIWAGGSNNTLDLSGWSEPATINLNPGTFSSANGMTNNIGIALDTIIENALGGSGGDTLTGNDADNTLNGGGGNDTVIGGAGVDTLIGGSGNDTLSGGPGADLLDGGGGTDTADYASSSAGVTVNLLSGTGSGGDAFNSIENVVGSAFNDTLTGSTTANMLEGGGAASIPRSIPAPAPPTRPPTSATRSSCRDPMGSTR